jgi:hypothetical protein
VSNTFEGAMDVEPCHTAVRGGGPYLVFTSGPSGARFELDILGSMGSRLLGLRLRLRGIGVRVQGIGCQGFGASLGLGVWGLRFGV